MSEEMVKLYSAWLKGTIAAIKKFSFYPAGHPTQTAAAASPYELLQNILSADQKLAISVKENRFILNGQTIPEDFTQNIFYQLFRSAAIKSVEIRAGITNEEFKAFLNYYAKRMMDRHYLQNLEDFLVEQGISSVIANKLQYVEVSERQEVISKTEKIRIDLKAQFAESLRDNPEFLRDILFGGPVSPEMLKDKYQVDLPLDKVITVVEQEVCRMSDEDLLNLISGKIKQELAKVMTEEVRKKEDLEALLEALKTQELRALFPEVEGTLKRYGLFNERILKKTAEERWKKNEKVIQEFSAMLQNRVIDSSKLNSAADKILALKDEKISEFCVERLVAEIESNREESRRVASLFLNAFFNKALVSNREGELQLIKAAVAGQLKDLKLPEPNYLEWTKIAASVTGWLIKKREYKPVKEILLEVRSRCHKEVVFSERVQKASLDFLNEIGNSETARHLVQDWLQSQDTSSSKEVEGVIKTLATEPVTEELVNVWAHRSPEIQQRILTLLRSNPETTLSCAEKLFSPDAADMHSTSARESTGIASRIKAVLEVMGALEEPAAVLLIGKLRTHPDSNLRQEGVRALNQHPLKAEAKGALCLFLKDPDPRIRKEVIESVASGADTRTVQALINHFSDYAEDRKSVCQALSRLEGEYAADFFLCLLTGKSRKGFNFTVKPEDEVRQMALNYLSRHLSPSVTHMLEEYLNEQHRHFFSFIKKDPLEGKIAALLSQARQTAHLSTPR